MQRQRHTAGSNLDALGNHRQCRAQHGGIRVQATKGLKMTLGCPDSRKTMTVRKLRALEQQPVFVVVVFGPIIREKGEAELDRFFDFALPPGASAWKWA